MFPCSHTFSLFAPLLHVINLLTTHKHTQFPPAKNKNKRRETFNLCDTSSQAFERNSQSIRVGWALELTLTFQVNHHNTFVHKLVKICLLPCSSWSSQWGICLLFVFPYTFTGFFDGDWFQMTDYVRLMMYKFVLSLFNDFFINEAFFQKTLYVLNTYFPFRLFCESQPIEHIGIKAQNSNCPCFFGSSGNILLQYIQFHFARWSIWGKIKMLPHDWTRSLDPSFRPLSLPLTVTTVSVVSPWTSPILPKANDWLVGCSVKKRFK